MAPPSASTFQPEEQSLFQHSAEEKPAAAIEAEVVTKDGTIVPVFMSSSVVPLHGRKLIQEMFKDVSAYRRAEREMRVKDSAIAGSGLLTEKLEPKKSFRTLKKLHDVIFSR